MYSILSFKSTIIAAALLALPVSQAFAMTKVEYKADKSRISADYKADKKACAAQSGNAKDICVKEAKGKEKVARAELENTYVATDKNRNKVLVAKAESAYAIAKEKCDDKSGNDKDVCVKEAKAVEVKALADAKMSKQIGAARKEGADDKRDADYKVAAEKCDAMTGDAKTSCMNSAKAKFGKT